MSTKQAFRKGGGGAGEIEKKMKDIRCLGGKQLAVKANRACDLTIFSCFRDPYHHPCHPQLPWSWCAALQVTARGFGVWSMTFVSLWCVKCDFLWPLFLLLRSLPCLGSFSQVLAEPELEERALSSTKPPCEQKSKKSFFFLRYVYYSESLIYSWLKLKQTTRRTANEIRSAVESWILT